jgi:SAM-dependent methyltransferase
MTAPRSPHDAWSAVAQAYQKHFAPSLKPGVEALCRYAGIKRGDRVLDIGCGPGTASFAAHALGAEVTGVDGAKGMIAVAEELAGSQRGITFLEGDLQDLPVPDASFDVVLSSFGIIFAPEPERAVAEVARVLVPGGRLALLAWPRAGAVGRYYDTIDRHIAPVAGADPHRWADLNQMRAWLGDAFDAVASAEVELPFTASSPEAAWETLRGSTGRVALAYQALAPAARTALDKEIVEFFWTCRKSDGTVVWPRKARMIRATRRVKARAAEGNIVRSFIAVLAGYLILAVLAVGAESAAATVLSVDPGARPARSYLMSALLGGGAAAGLGGWLTARLAPGRVWYHLAALAALLVVLTPPSGLSDASAPGWYRGAITGVGIVGLVMGGLVQTGMVSRGWGWLRTRVRSEDR